MGDPAAAEFAKRATEIGHANPNIYSMVAEFTA
jgi:hypothetical protein